MPLKFRYLAVFLYSFSTLFSTNKNHIPYMMQAGEVEKSISLYINYKKKLEKHDFEILQQMAFILLDQGARSSNKETQLLSIYGSGIAGSSFSFDILESGLKSQYAETQVAAIQFLGSMQDDRSDDLLVKAMSSPFFIARMETALHLANRKHKTSVGQIESLMYRVPSEARFLFPQFFALIGDSEAISILNHLMEDKVTSVRVESLLSAARFGRDDLLPHIRKKSTHINIAEQEAAAFALGLLQDSRSIKKLQNLLKTSPINVQISAARSLHIFGVPEGKKFLLHEAEKGNIFAIVSLSDISEAKDTLAKLCDHPELIVRLNAAITLLKQRDPRCRKVILELLLKNINDFGFAPQVSIGKTLVAFRPVFSASNKQNAPCDIRSFTHTIRQQILMDCINLPEGEFTTLAEWIFNSVQSDLTPTLVLLLENLQTPEAISLLKRKAETAGIPLIRAYCNLALYKMDYPGNYEAKLLEYIERNKNSELIRFKPLVPIEKRFGESPHELTPEDSSRLLIESFGAITEKQRNTSIDILLDAIQNGNPKNHSVLAGLLLRTLQ